MYWMSLILLILLGMLGIAGWLRSRQPNAGRALAPLEALSGWVGLIGVVWGLFLLIRALSYIGVLLRYAPLSWLLLLLTALVITALSLILVAPLLRQLIGRNGFTAAVDGIAAKLAPFRVGLGAACLALALWSILNYVF
jgi:hypothetical protein